MLPSTGSGARQKQASGFSIVIYDHAVPTTARSLHICNLLGKQSDPRMVATGEQRTRSTWPCGLNSRRADAKNLCMSSRFRWMAPFFPQWGNMNAMQSNRDPAQGTPASTLFSTEINRVKRMSLHMRALSYQQGGGNASTCCCIGDEWRELVCYDR